MPNPRILEYMPTCLIMVRTAWDCFFATAAFGDPATELVGAGAWDRGDRTGWSPPSTSALCKDSTLVEIPCSPRKNYHDTGPNILNSLPKILTAENCQKSLNQSLVLRRKEEYQSLLQNVSSVEPLVVVQTLELRLPLSIGSPCKPHGPRNLPEKTLLHGWSWSSTLQNEILTCNRCCFVGSKHRLPTLASASSIFPHSLQAQP